ncbi:LytTR family DNA-binding domain-containing protein [Flavobacteriaceae bacterium F89]|uniref:LytTR family DNA-binding domain-containing protein n=1 Tax=Cerina litoralis TaxID=2874477 RepID=A0AAE3JRG0_9FLAO|nr:LytTR family DNA-binding domain-containing protein [Cerina litoralis]MCG2459602.1 LytTR family DNA-binding domain-containing protein [Cerina litoralis]
MIKAIIIDDEQHCINRLAKLLTSVNNICLLGSYSTVGTGIQGIRETRPDLVFLDVQIHQKTGFDLLKEIGKVDFEVIFTTAFDTYAVQAFRFSAVDYLLKPIDDDDLKAAVEKVNEKLEGKDFERKMDNLLNNIHKKDVHKKISIPTFDGLEFVEVSDIIRCQADVNYTHIFIKNRGKIMVSRTLKSFENLLSECNFFRVHNSHLINLDHIQKYTKGKGGYITMIDNACIEVSSRRRDDFLSAIAN